jgi:hypothetical protein
MTTSLFSFALIALSSAGPQNELTSLESTVKAVYEVISGPAGHKRDWDKMRSLFQPEARMIAVGKTRTGEVRKAVLTVEDYIKQSGPILEERGFFEKEVSRKVERYGNIAHVFSTYEARTKADDLEPFMRGINSFQLWNDGKRWWVVTIYWQSEDPSTPIPTPYLPKVGGS